MRRYYWQSRNYRHRPILLHSSPLFQSTSPVQWLYMPYIT